MAIETSDIKFRYPGTKPFDQGQEKIFFGRDSETLELIHALKAHDVYVVFANSGIGKTSLLNARLIPELKNESFLPITFDFKNIDTDPLTRITNELEAFRVDTVRAGEEQKLWRLFKACNFDNKKVLFIFDQFEDFFNHPKPVREKCIAEIADLANNYIPEYINKEMLKRFRQKDPTETEMEYYSPAQVKMLFLIRSDKLNLMDDLSADIPLILRNRFNLKPLDVVRARKAILGPATLPQNGFATPELDFSEVVEDICTYLKNDEEEVESFQLQLICGEWEKKVKKRYEKQKPNALKVTKEDLDGTRGMDKITKNYYYNQIESIPDPSWKDPAKKLLEDELVAGDRRDSVSAAKLITKGYPLELLKYLEDNTRLIRGEKREKDQVFYQISHDRLLAPILESKEIRELKQKQDELRQKQDDERKKNLDLENRNKDLMKKLELQDKLERTIVKFRWTVAILIIVALGAIGAFFYASGQRVKSRINNVNMLLQKEAYGQADTLLEYHEGNWGMDWFYRDTLAKMEAYIHDRKNTKTTYDSLVSTGNELKDAGGASLIKALDLYLQARKLGSNKTYVPVDPEKNCNAKLNEAYKDLYDAYKTALSQASVFLDAGDKADATGKYQLAKQLSTRLNRDPEQFYLNKFLFLQKKLEP